jgi:hypothetical protein
MEPYERARVEASLARIEALAKLMDSAFVLPGSNVRVGLDAILGLVPVAGDLVSQAISTYIIWEARQLGVSRWTLMRMFGNTIVDTVVGSVPVLGDAFDVIWRANLKNLALLKKELAKRGYAGTVIEGTATRVPE